MKPFDEILSGIAKLQAEGNLPQGIYANDKTFNIILDHWNFQKREADPAKSAGELFGIKVYLREYIPADRIIIIPQFGNPIVLILEGEIK